MSTQMRPNSVGWVLAAGFFIGGLAFAISSSGTRLLGVIWAAVGAFLFIVYSVMGKRAGAKEKLWKEGIPGTATILDLTQTGTQINRQPVVKLHLRVEAQGIAPYEFTKRMVVPLVALGALSGGKTIPVRVDPKNRENMAIGFMSATETAGASGIDLRSNPAARDAVLKALKEHGIDVAHQTAADDPSTSVQASKDPLDRLQKLRQLKEAKLINEEEFLEQRKRILTDL